MLNILICCCMVILHSSLGLQIVYEKMEQLSGFDVMTSTLRVRKYNRTTTVLNGTLTLMVDMDDTFVVHSDFFHSSLGNQQFNHYPVKLPTKGTCTLITFVHENYPDAAKLFVNYPEKGECPIKPRDIHVIDHIFPSDEVPRTFPKGLWKAVAITKQDGVEKTNFELIVKVYGDNFF